MPVTMNDWSVLPDPHMRWIYDYNDPRYSDPATVQLRDRRWDALRALDPGMHDVGFQNDQRRRAEENARLIAAGRVPRL